MPTSHTVTSAADLLSVSPSHLRRTADAMADILPDYQPLPGQARKFSDNDLRTLQALFTRLETTPGLTRAQLLTELTAPGSPPLIIPETLPTRQPPSPPDSPRAPIAPPVVSDSPPQSHAALQALSTIAADVARLHARLDGLQSQPAPASPPRAPERLPLVLSGVAAGVLIFALVGVAIWQNTAAAVVCIAVALIAILLSIVAPRTRG